MTARDTVMAQIRRHGLTATDKAAIAAEQDGCAICGRPEPGGKGWVIDHDRTCCPGDRSCLDCRRGVLCQWCNNTLGYAQDSPTILRRAADYLEAGTRMHPDHVWDPGQLTDQLADQLTDQPTESLSESPQRILRTYGRTNEEATNPERSTSTSVPRTRIRRPTPPEHQNSGATRQPDRPPGDIHTPDGTTATPDDATTPAGPLLAAGPDEPPF